MKKMVIIAVCLIMLPFRVNATSGALQKKSIKQCPDGNYYGYHSSNKNIHWHLAEEHSQMSSGWAAVGEPLDGDPCPDDILINSNQNVIYENDQDMNISDDYSSINNNDTSDSKNVDAASNGDINDNSEEFIDGNQVSNNEVEEKTSTDNVDLTIKKFILGAGEVKFSNNKATITKLKFESSLDYSYELNDTNAKLDVYLNENKVVMLDDLKENDIVKLIVFDLNGNENIYEITIKNASTFKSIMVYVLSCIVICLPIVGIYILLKKTVLKKTVLKKTVLKKKITA